MDFVAKNNKMIGTTPLESEVGTGQKVYFSSNLFLPDEVWAEFTTKTRLLYVFASVTFSDELSGDQEVTTQVCSRLETNLNNWNHCASGHNQTIRPR